MGVPFESAAVAARVLTPDSFGTDSFGILNGFLEAAVGRERPLVRVD
jgi:hypothetical protein